MRKSEIVDRIVRKVHRKLRERAQDKSGGKRQRGGGVGGEILSGVETVTQEVANALMDLCGKSSGSTSGSIGTLAQDLIGTVFNISCATGQGLNLVDNLLELPANLGTAYKDPGAPGANLS